MWKVSPRWWLLMIFDDIADGIAEDASGNGYDAEVHDLYAKDDALRLKGEGYLSLPFDTLWLSVYFAM